MKLNGHRAELFGHGVEACFGAPASFSLYTAPSALSAAHRPSSQFNMAAEFGAGHNLAESHYIFDTMAAVTAG